MSNRLIEKVWSGGGKTAKVVCCCYNSIYICIRHTHSSHIPFTVLNNKKYKTYKQCVRVRRVSAQLVLLPEFSYFFFFVNFVVQYLLTTKRSLLNFFQKPIQWNPFKRKLDIWILGKKNADRRRDPSIIRIHATYQSVTNYFFLQTLRIIRSINPKKKKLVKHLCAKKNLNYSKEKYNPNNELLY